MNSQPEFIGKKVLVVEDNDVNMNLVADMLRALGVEVACASTGQEGVQTALKFLPDLILMDMRMPVMSGMQATKMLRRFPEFHDTPIIAMTASADLDSASKQLDAGCTATLPKPFRLRDLTTILSMHLVN